MAIGNLKKIRSIQNYKHYTEEEIIEMVQTIPTNQLEYDALIDQLYFFDYEKNEEKKIKKHRKNRQEYPVYTVRSEQQKQKKIDKFETA